MKNKIIILSVLVVILFSFFLPQLLFQIEDLKMEKYLFTTQKPKSKVDVQVEKIYLVKAIHDINEGHMNLKISGKEAVYYDDSDYLEVEPVIAMSDAKTENKTVINKLKDELLKLENAKVLKDINSQEGLEKEDVVIMGRIYSSKENEYEIIQFSWQSENYELDVETENKTGKILYLQFPKEKLAENISKKEVMENYVKYLDLYIIDDWNFENNMLQSKKAQLSVGLMENQNTNNCTLVIYPIQKNTKYYEVVESIE